MAQHAKTDVPPVGSPRDEYLDASTNARQMLTIRFAELTIFMTATGAILAVSFSAVAAPRGPEAALVLENRTMAYWNHFVGRAAALEAELGFRQYSGRPHNGLVSSHNAIRGLMILAAAFWLAAIAIVPGPA